MDNILYYTHTDATQTGYVKGLDINGITFVSYDTKSIKMIVPNEIYEHIKVVGSADETTIIKQTNYYILDMDKEYRIYDENNVVLFELQKPIYKPVFQIAKRHIKRYSERYQRMMSGQE